MKHPMQPFEVDKHGVVRFKKNKIVDTLLDWASARGFSLNEIACMEFSQEDRTQFSQLIGYSLCGFHELSHVSDEDALAATAEARKQNLLSSEVGGCRDEGCGLHCGVSKEETQAP